MIPKTWSIGHLFNKVIEQTPSFKFRDRDATVHYASAAAKCHRQVTYDALKTEKSNKIDTFALHKMRLGQYIEDGLCKDMFPKFATFGTVDLGGQGDTGEHGTFYGTSWHGYRDRDFMIKDVDGKNIIICYELKTKLGIGGVFTLKETPWRKAFRVPTPDTTWGNAQQVSLYLRDAYRKTAANPKKYGKPIIDGVLMYYVFHDGGAGNKFAAVVEFHCEYLPDEDTVVFYRAVCEDYPQCNGTIDVRVKLEDIAKRWQHQDKYINKGELAPPEFERKYDVSDERVENTTKTALQKAIKGEALIGDMQCKYCSYRDRCAKDLDISLEYTANETTELKNLLKVR